MQVQITDGVNLENAPWKPRSDAWTKKEFIHWVSATKKLGIEIIPELKFLTHQKKFFQNSYPQLMYNNYTYDPHKEKVYQHIFALLDEIVAIIHPKAVHIGHNDVAEHIRGSNMAMLSAELFLQDVLKLHRYLKRKGIETWMRGDMLISPDEFPDMNPNSLNGNEAGYGKEMRGKLPKDVVITDWHYFNGQADFPSLKVMKNEGFRVIGTTWKQEKTIRNFSQYAATYGAYGTMATTWFHVQRKEWDLVRDIIESSGKIFLKDFPDAK